MSHTSGNILLHFIFSTAQRRPLIKPEFRDDLFAYLGGIVREMHGTALTINGEPDHVHMLTRVRPAHSAAEIMRVLKRIRHDGYEKNIVPISHGRPVTASSALANPMLWQSPNTSLDSTSIIRGIHSRRSSLRY